MVTYLTTSTLTWTMTSSATHVTTTNNLNTNVLIMNTSKTNPSTMIIPNNPTTITGSTLYCFCTLKNRFFIFQEHITLGFSSYVSNEEPLKLEIYSNGKDGLIKVIALALAEGVTGEVCLDGD